MEKAFPYDTENVQNFKPKILPKWKSPAQANSNPFNNHCLDLRWVNTAKFIHNVLSEFAMLSLLD